MCDDITTVFQPVWMPKILRLVFSSGSGNSIFLGFFYSTFWRDFWDSQTMCLGQIFYQSRRPFCFRGQMRTISPVNSARPDQGWVKGLDPIGCHDHLKCYNVPIFLLFHNSSWWFEKRSSIQQWPWCHCAHQIHPTDWGVPTLSAESLFLRHCCCRTWNIITTTNCRCGTLNT